MIFFAENYKFEKNKNPIIKFIIIFKKMSQNLQTEPTETITIKDFLDNMIKEETISLKILEKSK